MRDYGDGMSLRTMAKATEYLFTSAADYEQEQQRQQQQQQSYQPTMEPMQGMGIGLPVSRLYARHWGGGTEGGRVGGREAGRTVTIYLLRTNVFYRTYSTNPPSLPPSLDIRLISVQGWGTDVAIYLSRKDLPEHIPIRVFD